METQRWERELRKLNTIEAPVGTRLRIEGGPAGDGLPPRPPRGQRIMAVVVAMGVFAAAGAFAFQALAPNAGEPVGGDGDGRAAGSVEPASALQVRCTERGLEVLTPVVAAQPDGLHVDPQVSGLTDPEISLRSLVEHGHEWWSGSSGVNGTFVRTVPVGEAVVHCESGPHQGDGPERFEATFEIVDPSGVYVEARLACDPRDHVYLQPDRLNLQARSLDAAVRDGVEGISASDIVEQAGYLESDSPWLVARVVREGRVIAALDVDGRGPWRFRVMGGRTCPDADVGPLVPQEGPLVPVEG
jgi:hypothetical protein